MNSNNESRQIPDEDLLRALSNMDQRISHVGRTQVEHGLLLEYIVQQIITSVNADGQSVIELDMAEGFANFAKERMQEIQEDVEKIKKEVMAKRAQAQSNG